MELAPGLEVRGYLPSLKSQRFRRDKVDVKLVIAHFHRNAVAASQEVSYLPQATRLADRHGRNHATVAQ